MERIAVPTQEERIAARRVHLQMSRRRQRPGSGSVLGTLLRDRGVTMDWWRATAALLARGGVAFCSGRGHHRRCLPDVEQLIERGRLEFGR